MEITIWINWDTADLNSQEARIRTESLSDAKGFLDKFEVLNVQDSKKEA